MISKPLLEEKVIGIPDEGGEVSPSDDSKPFVYNDKGLTSAEAMRLLELHGPNQLPEKKAPKWKIFFPLLIAPMPLMIIFSDFVEFSIGTMPDTGILLFINFANAGIGFYETTKAADAVETLKITIVRNLTILTLVMCFDRALIVLYYVWTIAPFMEAFFFVVVLMVASNPMAKEIVTNTTLALGSKELTKHSAIVPNPNGVDLKSMEVIEQPDYLPFDPIIKRTEGTVIDKSGRIDGASTTLKRKAQLKEDIKKEFELFDAFILEAQMKQTANRIREELMAHVRTGNCPADGVACRSQARRRRRHRPRQQRSQLTSISEMMEDEDFWDDYQYI